MSEELRTAVDTDEYEFVDYYDNDLSWVSDAYKDDVASEKYYED